MAGKLLDDPFYDSIWQELDGVCVICLMPAVTIHEIIPKGRCVGDWRQPENRVTLCNDCHSMVHKDGTRKWEDTLRRFRSAMKRAMIK